MVAAGTGSASRSNVGRRVSSKCCASCGCCSWLGYSCYFGPSCRVWEALEVGCAQWCCAVHHQGRRGLRQNIDNMHRSLADDNCRH